MADSIHPYFRPDYAFILYLWSPLVVMSACLLFLSPGLFLSLALNSAKGIGQWVLTGFVLSLVVISFAAGITQSVIGNSLRGIWFAWVVVGCSLGCFGILYMRVSKGHSLIWPLKSPYAVATLLSMVVIPLLLLITLTPKFYWENFNGDGIHAYEAARLLLFQPLPFWHHSAGGVALFPGITSMLFAFPTSWFIRLFGEVEASARLPFLLYIIALFGAILALVEYGRTKPLSLSGQWLIWLGLTIYVVVMAFSATYSPYSADIALPATQDTLLMVCFLGFILEFLRKEQKWMWLLIALTYFSSPNGILLICFWLLSVLLIWRRRPWKQIVLAVSASIVCLIITAVAPFLLTLVNQSTPGGEYAFVGFLRRFAFLQWADWRRILFIVIPSGILPSAALLMWRSQDKVARSLTVVTVTYFFFFYVQAHIVLHHFVPAMILPIVVFWRNEKIENSRYKSPILVCIAIIYVVALLISLPQSAAPHTIGRFVGTTIEDRIGGYENHDPAAFRRSEMLRHLFPYTWDQNVPFESYGGSPLIWNYYANQACGTARNVNYVLQPATQPPPIGMHLQVQEENVALYIRSFSVWESHLAIRPPTPVVSKVYEIPRGIIFRSVPLKDGPPIINVVEVLEELGIDMGPILSRLGVER